MRKETNKFMNPEEMHKYDDILEMPHHVSRSRPQMPVADRAAQFAPFAALSGHYDAVKEAARAMVDAPSALFIGRGMGAAASYEGALKLKEISYLHAEAYAAGEMKHGPIALIDAEMPTVAIATPDHTYEKTASNIEEIKARGGKIIAVIARGDEQVRRSADFVIEVPVIAECLMPIVVSVPLQLLAYYIAVYKGRNVDQPRNLAKSVTVE